MARRLLGSHGELALVFTLGTLAQLELWIDAEWSADRYELAPVALAMTTALLLRIRLPLLTLVLEVVGLQIMAAVNTAENNDPMGIVILGIVAIYSAGAHTRGRALVAATLLVLVTTIVIVVEDGSSLNVSGFLSSAFWSAARSSRAS